VEERNIAFPIIAGIVGFALVVGYAGYCFYSTAEMIKPDKKNYEKLGINLPLSFEKNPPSASITRPDILNRSQNLNNSVS
jgi:hypothetical protein